MKKLINAIKFHIILLKPFWLYFIIMFGLSFFFMLTLTGRAVGIFYLMSFMALTVSYPFQLEEKNNTYRFFGMIPIDRSSMVTARYLFYVVAGFLLLIVFIPLQPLIFGLFNKPFDRGGMWMMGFLAYGMYLLLISLQIPGFYKLGLVKGRFLYFVPLVLIFGISYIMEFFQLTNISISERLIPWIGVVVIIVIVLGSWKLAQRFFREKEL